MPTKSNFITKRSALKLFNAFTFSEQANLPLTVAFTIAWMGCDQYNPINVHKLRSRFIRNYARWCRRVGIPTAYLWVMESSLQKGIHTHFLLHIPTREHFAQFNKVDDGFQNLIPNFVRNRFIAHVHQDRRFKYRKFMTHPNCRIGSLQYVLKGIDPKAKVQLNGKRIKFSEHIGVEPEPTGSIMGKRTGISGSLIDYESKISIPAIVSLKEQIERNKTPDFLVA